MHTPELPNEELDHPIPRLDVIDIHGVLKSGGTDLVIVIASPLAADEYSQLRLVRKLNNYIEFIGSKGYAQQFGVPTPENTAIVVNIHTGSAPEVFHLLEQCQPRVQASNASLSFETIDVTE